MIFFFQEENEEQREDDKHKSVLAEWDSETVMFWATLVLCVTAKKKVRKNSSLKTQLLKG